VASLFVWKEYLVGQNAGSEGLKPEKVSSLASKFVDSEYSLGDKSRGFDCLNMLLDFYDTYPWPEEFKGFTRENYAHRWQSGEGKKEWEDFLLSLGTPIEKNYMQQGDLIIMYGKGSYFPAVYLGNDHIILITEIGGRVIPLNKLIEFGVCKPIAYRRMIN